MARQKIVKRYTDPLGTAFEEDRARGRGIQPGTREAPPVGPQMPDFGWGKKSDVQIRDEATAAYGKWKRNPKRKIKTGY